MHHNFGLKPFPLTARRSTRVNSKPVAVTAASAEAVEAEETVLDAPAPETTAPTTTEEGDR